MKFKYNWLFVLLACVVTSEVSAQQLPLYSQYYFNKFIYNPAFAGEQEKMEAYIISRRQWTGVPGYETNALTVSGVPGNTNVGLGLHVVNDKNSIVKTNSVYGSYAYRIKLDDKQSYIALGMALGLWDARFNMNNIVVTDPNDPVIPLLNNNGGPIFDANLGLNVKAKNLQVGLALPQVFSNRQNFRDNYNKVVDYNLQTHFIATVSYDIWAVPDKLKIQPFIMYKSTKNAPDQVDANLMLDWIGKGWLGAAYRDDYAVTFTGGIKVASMLRVGYAYDMSISNQSAALGGTHELTLGISLDKKDRFIEEDIDEKEKIIGESMKDSMQEVKIQELTDEVEALKKQGGTKDTVVLVKRIETIVKQPVTQPETPTKTQPGAGTGSGSTPGKSSGVSESGKYMLVAGSFSEKKYADAYVNRLKNMGQNSAVYQAPNGTYYVHVGRFDDKDKARQVIKSNQNSSLKLWIKSLE